MNCDFKNCRLYVSGECIDEEERDKCPLMEARLELRSCDDALRKLRKQLENAYQLIGELTE